MGKSRSLDLDLITSLSWLRVLGYVPPARKLRPRSGLLANLGIGVSLDFENLTDRVVGEAVVSPVVEDLFSLSGSRIGVKVQDRLAKVFEVRLFVH